MSQPCFKLSPIVLATALALGTLAPAAALAQSTAATAQATFPIKLSAQPLGSALNELARQAGLQLLVQRELVEGKRAPAVNGQLTARQALDRLLVGSGLAVTVEGNAVVVKAAPPAPAADAPTLQTVEVFGRAETEAFSEFSFAATKTQTHILDIPQSISAVTKEVIEEQNLRLLNDIAPYVAGVNEFSTYNDLTIRGFRSSDDRRLNGMRVFNNFWSQPPIAHLERVEVIKGPAAAMFGDASPGGVINLVSKKLLQETRREVQAGIGSHDYRYAAADLTGALNEGGSVLYRLNAAVEDTDTFRDLVTRNNKTLAPSFSLLLPTDTRINLDWVYVDAEGVVDRGQPNVRNSQSLGQVPIKVSFTQVGDRVEQENSDITVSLEQKLNKQWTGVVSYMHSRYDEHFVEHRNDRWITDTTLSLRYGDRRTESRIDSLSAYLSGDLRFGDWRHKIVAGVDHMDREDGSDEVFARGTVTGVIFDVLNPVNTVRNVSAYALTPYFWNSAGKTTGIYLQDQMSVGNWDFMLGLRQDRYRTSGDDDGVPNDPQSDRQFSPRLSIGYKLTDSSNLYGSWLTGFQPPESWTASALYGGPFKPEESELFEIGYKQMFNDDRLLFTTALYQLTKKNAIVWANDDDNPDLYIQRGEERAHGLELELSGQLTPRIGVIANYAYNDAKVTDDPDPANVGKRKENAPRHAASIWGRYRLDNGLSAGLGMQYVGKRATFDTLELPAYTIFNAGLFYTLSSTEIALTVKNLADKTHWTGGYNYERTFPGDPRSVNLTLKHRF
jgi:iron complex outermembrane receptor protein